MIDQVKAKLIDLILSGQDIYCYTADPTEHHLALFTKPYNELFRWKSDEPVANPVTLKRALEIVDHHWNRRVGPQNDQSFPQSK